MRHLALSDHPFVFSDAHSGQCCFLSPQGILLPRKLKEQSASLNTWDLEQPWLKCLNTHRPQLTAGALFSEFPTNYQENGENLNTYTLPVTPDCNGSNVNPRKIILPEESHRASDFVVTGSSCKALCAFHCHQP